MQIESIIPFFAWNKIRNVRTKKLSRTNRNVYSGQQASRHQVQVTITEVVVFIRTNEINFTKDQVTDNNACLRSNAY